MGATVFTQKALGKDVNEVFQSLVEEARHYNGYDPYNGTISTTQLHRELNLSKELAKAVKNSDWSVMEIEENDRVLYPSKWETNYIKELKHYEAFTPTWVSDKQTPIIRKGVRTITRYTIMTNMSRNSRTFATLTEAKREAKQLAIRVGEDVTIKQHRSNGEMFQLGHMRLKSDNKVHRSARKTKTKTYLPVYEFTFFVYAAC